MFKISSFRQSETALKKGLAKFFDPKKDVAAKLKHLKYIIENNSEAELHLFFQEHYSLIFFVFFENFLLIEASFKGKGSHRSHREDLNGVISLFKLILIHLPDLVRDRWQYRGIYTILKKLLHPKNSFKIRKEGVYFYLLWLSALRENSFYSAIFLYKCLVPGLGDKKKRDINYFFAPPRTDEIGVYPPNINRAPIPHISDKRPKNTTKYFLDAILESMVLKVHALQWNERETMMKQTIVHLWNLFVEHFINKAFPEFHFSTNIFTTYHDTASSDKALDVLTTAVPTNPLYVAAKVSIIKWIATFVSPAKHSRKSSQVDRKSTITIQLTSRKGSTPSTRRDETTSVSSPPNLASASSSVSDQSFDLSDSSPLMSNAYGTIEKLEVYASEHNSSCENGLKTQSKALVEINKSFKALLLHPKMSHSTASLCSLDYTLDACSTDQIYSMRTLLFSTRKNINIVHEVFRQSFMLPMGEAAVIRRVIRVYRLWIQSKNPPIFMQMPARFSSSSATGGEFNLLDDSLRPFDDPVPSVSKQHFSTIDVRPSAEVSVRAGPQSTYQFFITSSAFVFVSNGSQNEGRFLSAQIDICKRILSVYRHMIVNVYLSGETWVHFLRVLLYVTRRMLDQAPKARSKRKDSLAGTIAGPVFQTLIVSWIKANLCVSISRELWDDLVDLFSTHCQWEELIVEWSKNMEVLTRVLAKYVYRLELTDLPLDRLTEQYKIKRQNKETSEAPSQNRRTASLYEQAFQRGILRRSVEMLTDSSIREGESDEFLIDFNSAKSDSDALSLKDVTLKERKLIKKSSSLAGLTDDNLNRQANVFEAFKAPGKRSDSDSLLTTQSLVLMDQTNQSQTSFKAIIVGESKSATNQPATLVHAAESYSSNFEEYEHEEYVYEEDADAEDVCKDKSDDFDILVGERLKPAKLQSDLRSIDSQDSVALDQDLNFLLEAGNSFNQPYTSFPDGGTSGNSDSRETTSPTNIAYQLYQSRPVSKSSSAAGCSTSDQALSFHYQKDELSSSSAEASSTSPSNSSDRKTNEDFSSALASEMDAILPEIPEEDENLDFLFLSSTPNRKKIPAKSVSAEKSSVEIKSSVCMHTGWSAVVAVVLWRRILGVLGDVNEIEDPDIHEMVFRYLVDLWNVLYKMRQNIGVAIATSAVPVAVPTTDDSDLVPPLQMLSPWAFKTAMNLPDSHRDGKLHAFQLLCKVTLQKEHDLPLDREHLAQFYTVLHETLLSKDQGVVNKVVGSCSDYYLCCLPGSSLLLLDFMAACKAVCLSSSSQAPRVEALTIFGSALLFSNIYRNMPVIKPESPVPVVEIKQNFQNDVVDCLLIMSRIDQNPEARCLALSCCGLWLYDEFTSDHRPKHPKVTDLLNVLMATLKARNPTVANAACSQLRLLSNCSKNILEGSPSLPTKIIEIFSLSLWNLLQGQDTKRTEPGRQLIISHLFALLEWCMVVPLNILLTTIAMKSEKQLIRRVIKAIQCATLSKFSQNATKHSTDGMDSNLMDQMFDNTSTTGSIGVGNSKNKSKKSPDTSAIIILTAKVVLKHLINYLDHYPLARGASVLASMVSEHHDLSLPGSDELSPALFNSPEVQFLVCDNSCLLSVVELPSELGKPGGGPTAGMTTADRCVRFIVRDVGGKYCWDSYILHGPPNIAEMTAPVICKPSTKKDEIICKVAKKTCQTYLEYAKSQKKIKHHVKDTPLPSFEKEGPGKLDQLLQHMGASSPECQIQTGFPLNVPAPSPPCISSKLENDVMEHISSHYEKLQKYVNDNICNAKRYPLTNKMNPQPPPQILPSFYHARILCSELGFLSRDSRKRIHMLKKNERLLRELKNLDAGNCRETHKVAVLYVANGQEDKISILSNSSGSKEYEEFVAGLGWEVDLSKHCGFRGKLQSDGSTGKTCPYYATSTLEIIFHVSTRFPSNTDSAQNVKIRHLGNDEVHIVWSEHHRDYRRGIIPTEFGDVMIVIYPIHHGLFRIQIIKKDEIPYFGPLFDGAIVSGRVLPVLVRETAINAGRAKRSMITLFQSYYEERNRYLQQIMTQYKDAMTFEDYCANLFNPIITQNRKISTVSKLRPPVKIAFTINKNNSNNVSSLPPLLSTSPKSASLGLKQPVLTVADASKQQEVSSAVLTSIALPTVPLRKKSVTRPPVTQLSKAPPEPTGPPKPVTVVLSVSSNTSQSSSSTSSTSSTSTEESAPDA